MAEADVPHDEGQPLAARLVGLPIPSVRLGGGWHSPVDLAEYVASFPLVVFFFYPGAPGERPDGPDAQQRRAFNAIEPELTDKRYRILGVSSEFEGMQQHLSGMERLSYVLLSDPALWVADALGLPTLKVEGRPCYARSTLVAVNGVIRKAFYPVSSPVRSAAQVLTWTKVHGL
jgi:peroxiredoxin